MNAHSNNDPDKLRDKIIGLGEKSGRKNYYTELKKRLTELETIQETLRKSEANLKSILDNIQDAIVIHDEHGSIIYANHIWLDMHGVSEEECLSSDIYHFSSNIAPVNKLPVIWKSVMNGANQRFEWTTVDKNQEIYYCDVILTRVYLAADFYILACVRNITERRKNEEALLKSEQEKLLILSAVEERVIYMDKTQTVIWANSAAIKSATKSEAEILGAKCYDLWPELCKQISDCPVKRTIASGSIQREEIRTGDGKIFDIQGYPVSNGQGAVIGAVEVIQDITDRKTSEEKIRDAEERYRTLVANIPGIVYRCLNDDNWTMLYISDGVENITGYPASDFISNNSRSFASVIDPIDNLRMTATKDIELIPEQREYNKEYKIIHKDGSIRWVHESGTGVFDENGKILYLDGVIIDVTEQKKAENALRHSESKNKALINSIPDTMLIINKTGIINDFKLSSPQCPLLPDLEKVHCSIKEAAPLIADSVLISLDSVLSTGAPRSFEQQSGNQFFELRVIKVDSDNVLVIIRDVTESRKYAENLLKMQRLESLGVLAGGIAHDFNNLLNGIFGNIDMAILAAGKSSEATPFLEEAMSVLDRAKDLTRQLLTFSKGGSPVKKTVKLKDTIIKAASFATKGSKTELYFSIPDDLWPCEVDANQIAQVIDNLCINAVQAMQNGGTLKIAASNLDTDNGEKSEAQSLPCIRISVQDSGQGIPQDIIPKIFDPFFTTKPNGNGLGLATVYSIINKHSGSVEVDSVTGQGTCFTIQLPAQPGKAETEKTVQAEDESHPFVKAKILLMDDEAFIIKLISAVIKELGHDVTGAKNGDEAADIYKASFESGQPFDLLILDLTVKGGNGGKEAMEKILAIDPKANAIVSSGYSNDPVVADYKAYGFSGYISKPYKINELKAAINGALKSRK